MDAPPSGSRPGSLLEDIQKNPCVHALLHWAWVSFFLPSPLRWSDWGFMAPSGLEYTPYCTPYVVLFLHRSLPRSRITHHGIHLSRGHVGSRSDCGILSCPYYPLCVLSSLPRTMRPLASTTTSAARSPKAAKRHQIRPTREEVTQV